jgi:ketosteroid isomerase-like protein
VVELTADSGTAVNDHIQLIEEFRDAYQRRDINRLMGLFADDAELTWAVGTFRGKAAVRKVFEWDFRLSPAVNVRDAGVGVISSDHTVVFERVVEATAEGIPYEERAVTIYEMNDAGQIHRMRSYYDKLSILHQVASRYPGLRGRLLRSMTGFLVRLGSRGLTVSPS